MKGLLLTLTFIIASVSAAAQAPKTFLKVGDKAPDFSLPNGDGKEVKLSELTSKSPLLLVFYRGYW
jgi:peroxiredoxin